MSIKSYVLRTNYEEYAVILMKKTSNFGPTTTLKLYGMSAVELWASKLWGGLSNAALWLWSWCLQSTHLWHQMRLSFMAQLRAVSHNEH